MVAGKALSWAAVLTLAVGGFVEEAVSQDTRPSADSIAERLRARGIDVSPEQIEQGRKIMEDLRNGVQPDPEQIQKILEGVRKQLQTRLKEALGATDEEWQVLGPKIEKVQKLMLQSGDGGMAMARLGMGGVNTGGGTEQTEVQKKLQALQELRKNKDASTEDIRAALKDYRDAKAKAKAELEKARAELRELLTVKQEAQLVLMGLLE
jgi:DNA repair exonuclease SbcCD ATPase subunit